MFCKQVFTYYNQIELKTLEFINLLLIAVALWTNRRSLIYATTTEIHNTIHFSCGCCSYFMRWCRKLAIDIEKYTQLFMPLVRMSLKLSFRSIMNFIGYTRNWTKTFFFSTFNFHISFFQTTFSLILFFLYSFYLEVCCRSYHRFINWIFHNCIDLWTKLLLMFQHYGFFLSLLCLYFDCMQIERTLLSKEKITKRTQYSDYTPFNNFDHWCGSFLVENNFFLFFVLNFSHLCSTMLILIFHLCGYYRHDNHQFIYFYQCMHYIVCVCCVHTSNVWIWNKTMHFNT